MTPKIAAAIAKATALQELEDIYRPFRPKRRTRAAVAKEKGLEPLAARLFMQGAEQPETLAEPFVSEEVPTIEEALQGAGGDILAEQFADDPALRALIRNFTYTTGLLVSEGSDTDEIEQAKEFEMYFDYYEDVHKIPPHRILALNRGGERLKVLKVRIEVDRTQVVSLLSKNFFKTVHPRLPHGS